MQKEKRVGLRGRSLIIGMILALVWTWGGAARRQCVAAAGYENYKAWDNAGGGYGGHYLAGGCLVMAQTKLWIEMGVKSAEAFTPDSMMAWLRGQGLVSGWDTWMGAGWTEKMALASDDRIRYVGYLDTSGWSAEEIRQRLIQAANQYEVAILELPNHYVLTDAALTRTTGVLWTIDSVPADSTAERLARNSAPFTKHYDLREIEGMFIFVPGPKYQTPDRALNLAKPAAQRATTSEPTGQVSILRPILMP